MRDHVGGDELALPFQQQPGSSCRFAGVLDASFHNPCGLKRAGGGGNYDPAAHQRFKSWRLGVRGCLDHLALYAAAKGYPRTGSPDPRHFPSIRGKATTVEQLGGKWAPSAAYGDRLVQKLTDLRRTPR